jgi:8-oxo-dGTP diphosphatase
VHTVGVCGLVTNADEQVLLIRTAKAGWELPGGRVESGEDLHAALRREVLEETGYALRGIGPITGVYAHTASDTLLVVIRATAENTALSDTRDVDALEAAWFDPAEALSRVTHPSEHDRLADALAKHREAVYRAY